MMLAPKVDMNIFETILARRSVRQYKARVVDQALLRTLLEAAVRAPTAMHQEPWGFIIVQDKKLLHQLSAIAKPIFLEQIKQRSLHTTQKFEGFNQADFNIFYNANTLVLICGKAAVPFVEADCWLAAENLMLAACAMGLGTCIIASALPAFSIAKVRSMLAIPADYTVVVPIIVGYPDDEITQSKRNNPLILANISGAQSAI
ncbi:MAG TPA: nitroreductase family protein [Methylophilaceae bacterium]|nr:nitroreductase family protein [Methylophilaceae bacterium]